MVNESKTGGSRVFDCINITFFVLVSFLFLYPFYSIVVDSFSTPSAAMIVGLKFYPAEFSLAAYNRVFSSPPIWTGYANTIFVVVCNWVIGLILTICGAYPLSKRDLPNRGFWTMLVVFTMFFDGGLIPSYLLVRNLGWMNSYWSLIFPALSTWNLILLRNYFMALPQELFDAASIDGASEVHIVKDIIIPISKPILATISLFIIVGTWNSWFNCLIYIRDTNKMVLQVILRRILDTDSKEIITVTQDALDNAAISIDRITVRAASIMVATVPILCIYPFIQKYFVKGIMVGSLKG